MTAETNDTATSEVPDARYTAPSIALTVAFRHIGEGVESLELQWERGTNLPTATDLCRIIDTILDRKPPAEVAGMRPPPEKPPF